MASLCEAGGRVGRYLLLEKIGRGGFAEVWKAHDEGLNRSVAIKMALPELAEREEFVARFLREARLAAKLEHPNILAVHDLGTDGGRPYLVMPFVPGGSLADRILQGPPIADSLDCLAQLAAALDFAHGEMVIHRDVKPENALFDRRGRLLLTDFGIGRSLEEATVLTRTGACIGTPAYMSPEQVLAEPETHPIGPASDQFALGVIAYKMLVGKPPFDGITPVLLQRIVFNQAPLPSECRPALPPPIDAVFGRVLAKDPRSRYRTCEAFIESLRVELALAPGDRGANGTIGAAEPRPQGVSTPRRESRAAGQRALGSDAGAGTERSDGTQTERGAPEVRGAVPGSGPDATVRSLEPTSVENPVAERNDRDRNDPAHRTTPVLCEELSVMKASKGIPDSEAGARLASRLPKAVPTPGTGHLAGPADQSITARPEGSRTEPEGERRAATTRLSNRPSPRPTAEISGIERVVPSQERRLQPALPEEISLILPGNVGLEMALIAGGTFQMGAPEEERGSFFTERPVHQVFLSRVYHIGKYLVSQRQWVAVTGRNPSYFPSQSDRSPVEGTSWNDISRANDGFIALLNSHLLATGQTLWGRVRLPTEAEWERAARGGTQTRFSFGAALESGTGGDAGAEASQYACFSGYGVSAPQPVGARRPNPFGLFDVHGNLWEWCE